MSIILGIDTGKQNIGLASYDTVSQEVTCYPNQSSLMLKDYYNDFQYFIVKGNFDLVVFEKPFFTTKTLNRNITTLETIGIQKLVCEQNFLPYYEASPKTVKKHMTGNGNAKKEDVIEAINNKFDLKLNVSNSHVADAVAIAYTFELWHRP